MGRLLGTGLAALARMEPDKIVAKAAKLLQSDEAKKLAQHGLGIAKDKAVSKATGRPNVKDFLRDLADAYKHGIDQLTPSRLAVMPLVQVVALDAYFTQSDSAFFRPFLRDMAIQYRRQVLEVGTGSLYGAIEIKNIGVDWDETKNGIITSQTKFYIFSELHVGGGRVFIQGVQVEERFKDAAIRASGNEIWYMKKSGPYWERRNKDGSWDKGELPYGPD